MYASLLYSVFFSDMCWVVLFIYDGQQALDLDAYDVVVKQVVKA